MVGWLPRISFLKRIGLATALLDRRGSVALIYAFSAVPIVTVVALAVDYSFYVQTRSQLDLAADAAAMHAVRAASQAYALGYTAVAAEQAVGVAAGRQWFDAQLGTLTSGIIANEATDVNVSVAYNASPGTFTSSVTYKANVPTHIAANIKANWPVSNVNSAASAVISNSYVEILLLLDDSSSMLIPSTASGMAQLEAATPCSPQTYAIDPGLDMNQYTWYYASGYGYPTTSFPSGSKVPQPGAVNGACSSAYHGDSSACFYVPNAVPLISPITGLCPSGLGANGSGGRVASSPRAPCAFACHSSASNLDYYGLARTLSINLRLDVVEQAAASVITTLQTQLQTPNQFSVGVYEFNNALTSVFPGVGQGEASTNLTAGLVAVQSLAPPLTSDIPNTYFPGAAATLASLVTQNGNGLTPATPVKNLFIVTDGVSDTSSQSASQVLGPITSAVNEQSCQAFKNKGFNVYVLYTPYLPIPVPTYINQMIGLVEPQSNSQITAALQACASSPANFFPANSPSDINAAMQKMLLTALNSAGRISQ